MDVYTLLRDGAPINLIVWDGRSKFDLPEGVTIRRAQVGDEVAFSAPKSEDVAADPIKAQLDRIEASLTAVAATEIKSG